MDRLEEVLRLARTLYDRGLVSADGPHVVARDLPLSPVPATPPRLLVGGGSDRVLRMAGRYAVRRLARRGTGGRGGTVRGLGRYAVPVARPQPVPPPRQPGPDADALLERREAYGLERISLSGEGGIAAAPPDPLRFCREVLPLLGREGRPATSPVEPTGGTAC